MKKAAKKSVKKKSASKATTRKAAARKISGRSVTVVPAGHIRTPGGIFVPQRALSTPATGVVPASKLEKGISDARAKISGVLEELVEATRENYEITEIELSASFNADGKFLGFGVGGEMSITFRVKPAGA